MINDITEEQRRKRDMLELTISSLHALKKIITTPTGRPCETLIIFLAHIEHLCTENKGILDNTTYEGLAKSFNCKPLTVGNRVRQLIKGGWLLKEKIMDGRVCIGFRLRLTKKAKEYWPGRQNA